MQKALPDQMMNLIIKEFDGSNMGDDNFNALHIIQSIKQSSTEFKRSLLHHLYGSNSTTNTYSLPTIINQTILNPGAQSMKKNNNGHQNEVQVINKDDGV